MTNPIDTMAIQACRADGKDPYEPDYMRRVEGRPGPPQWLEYRPWAEWWHDNFGARPEGEG